MHVSVLSLCTWGQVALELEAFLEVGVPGNWEPPAALVGNQTHVLCKNSTCC